MSKQLSSLCQAGQLAESRSLIEGFRGAWFRCEIKEVVTGKWRIRCHVRYYDYDDDDLEWLDLYQIPRSINGSKKAKRELMLRPQFPPIYHESELPHINASSDVAIVVDGGWSVGDMVDWLKDGCYWCGTITEILDDDTVQVKFPDPPVGEGMICDASFKDLRPTLKWRPDSGWTFPDSTSGHSHARLIQPAKQALLQKSLDDVVLEGNPNPKATPRSLLDVSDSISSHTSASSLPLLNKLMRSKCSPKPGEDISGKDRARVHGESMEMDPRDSATRKPSCSDSVSSAYINGALTEAPVVSSAKKQDAENISAKRLRVNEPIPLNSTYCDSTESTIMDLEELVCRVKWLKQILKYGSLSTSMDNKWEFLEYPAVSEPN
ncbi:uncharacterized protein LOC141606545 isoform X2 [Silene latifolia]|uniref:uncharacterized protein LOC141606545 isoform X2 n=1 Tax=Silene latifolia TaxID=37657 RepID=UPI003D77F433